jgi:hypothetical protein
VQLQNIEIITLSYPYGADEVRDLFAQHFPDATPSELDVWVAECEPAPWTRCPA